MILSDTPKLWLDRKAAFADDEFYPAPLAERMAALDDWMIEGFLAQGIRVAAFDPGGSTGWSIMYLDIERMFDREVRAHQCVTRWYHGEIDCGSMSGDITNSAIAQGYDLGRPETGEQAGVWLMDRLIHADRGVPGTAVVLEDFILRTATKSRDALSPVRLNATIEHLIWREKVIPMPVYQQPAEAKTTVTDERLKLWGFWGKGSRHARDADRHALTFIRKTREQHRLILERWPILAEGERRGMLELKRN